MSWKILVTARAFWVSGNTARKRLEEAGCVVVNSPVPGPVPENELISLLQGCQAVIGSSDPYTGKVFEACPDLRVVARCGVGIDSVDVDASNLHGIVVTNTPGAMTEAVADYAFAMMLGVTRKIPEGDAMMRSGGWGELSGVLVYGKTLGIVGFGRIGQAVAKRAVGFGMKILVFDPLMEEVSTSLASLGSTNLPVKFVEFDDLLSQSDFVSLHAPNVTDTRHMFNAAAFHKMKRTAYFINTSRGQLVNTAALLAALQTNQIAGAAIDVYEQEPLPANHPIRSAPNCLLTPHNAFNAIEAAEAMSEICVDNVLLAMQGEKPDNIINPEVLTSESLRVHPVIII